MVLSPDLDRGLGRLSMLRWLERASGDHRRMLLAIAAASEGVIAVIDVMTGQYLSMRLFYLIPVVIVAWSIGRLAGWIFALGGAVIDTVVQLVEKHGHQLLTVVQGVLAAAVLVAVATFVTETSVLLRRERDTARRDYLTGVLNRRAFDESADIEVARAKRGQGSLSLVMLDIDKFKEINDTMGHEAGDAVLRGLAEAVTSAVRATDVVARVGGDEFVVLCPATLQHEALTLARRIHARFGDVYDGSSISIGVASSPPARCEIDALMNAADSSMYEAKRLGKGIVSSIPEAASSEPLDSSPSSAEGAPLSTQPRPIEAPDA